MNNIFAYVNDEDKAYGITGMVISLNIWNDFSILQEVSMDNAHGEAITFTPDFFFCANPRYSAKIAWNEMLKQYQMYIGIVVANILCRHKVRNHKALNSKLIADIMKLVEDDGREACSLENDEISVLFNKTVHYIDNLFDDYSVTSLINRFAQRILERRTMTGSEVLDELHLLQR